MPDTVYLRDLDTMTAVERREYIIGLNVAKEYAETAYYEALREVIRLRAELSGRMEIEAETEKNRDAALMLLSTIGIKEPCDAYRIVSGKAVCYGTKDCDPCSCGGDKTRCTHYPRTGTGEYEAGA